MNKYLDISNYLDNCTPLVHIRTGNYSITSEWYVLHIYRYIHIYVVHAHTYICTYVDTYSI